MMNISKVQAQKLQLQLFSSFKVQKANFSFPDFFHFPRLFPDHFGIPRLFQVIGHPAHLH